MKNNKIKFLLSFLTGIVLSSIIFAQDKQNANAEKNNSVEMQVNSPFGKEKSDGVVRLKIVFLSTGKIGDITVVSSNISKNLVKQAIEAAQKIRFDPAKKNGVPQTTIATVEYTFSIFYEENSTDLRKNAEILEMPQPKHPQGDNLKIIGGKVNLTLKLHSNGNVEVSAIKSDLPQEFQDEATKAALRLTFKPAIDKNGNQVTQTKEIEYEFKPQKD